MYQENPLASSYEEIMKLMESHAHIDNTRVIDRNVHEDAQCEHCEIMNKMLQLTQLQYERLEYENFAGEITISYLKNKNDELNKLLKNKALEEETACSSSFAGDKTLEFVKEEHVLVQSSSMVLENFIDTFNPKELRKIFSSGQINSPRKTESNPENRKNENIPENRNPVFKKHFSISQFKIKHKLDNKENSRNIKISPLNPNRKKKALSSNETNKFQFYRF